VDVYVCVCACVRAMLCAMLPTQKAGPTRPLPLTTTSPIHPRHTQTTDQQALEKEVAEAAAAGRKLKLLNATLRELVMAKAKNDEEEEATLVGELRAQNADIRALLVRELFLGFDLVVVVVVVVGVGCEIGVVSCPLVSQARRRWLVMKKRAVRPQMSNKTHQPPPHPLPHPPTGTRPRPEPKRPIRRAGVDRGGAHSPQSAAPHATAEFGGGDGPPRHGGHGGAVTG
jgi:hypothetical protein